MYHPNVFNKITYLPKLIKNPAFIAKSNGFQENRTNEKGTHNVMVICYSIPLRGDRINPSYNTNWKLTACQGITYSKLATETSTKAVTYIQIQQSRYHKNVNSIISMSLLAILKFTTLPPSLTLRRYLLVEFQLQELFWKQRKFQVHNPHPCNQ